MKKGKKTFWILEILLCVVLLWIFGMIWRGNKPVRKKRIVCVVNDSSSQRWMDMYEGMQLFAKRHNLEFIMADTERMQTASEVKEVIADEMTDGMDALIVEQIGADPDDMLPESLGRNIPKVYLNGQKESNLKEVSVSFAAKKMVQKIFQEMRQDEGDLLSGGTVGMIFPNSSNPYFAECLKQAEKEMKKEGMEEEWILHLSSQDQEGQKQLRSQQKADYIIAFDDASLKAAGECAQNGGVKGNGIYGVGNSEDTIWYLEHGIIQGMFVPDTFMMGYRAMEASFDLLEHRSIKENLDVSGRYFRKEDLFASRKNQAYLFPREEV